MTIQLFSVLSAAALAATGLGATTETRSAQSLPAHNLVVAPIAAASGKFKPVTHLVDAAPTVPSDESNCSKDGGHWDDKTLSCSRGAWWKGSGVRLLIGAGTVAGIIVAVSESSNNSVSN